MAGRWMGRRCAGDVRVAAAAAAVAGAGRCRAAAIRWTDKHFWRRCCGGGGGGDGDRLLAADDRLGAAGLLGNVAVDVGVAVVVDADFVEIIAGTVDVITFTMDVAVVIVVVVVVYVIVIVIDRNSHTILIIDLVSGCYH